MNYRQALNGSEADRALWKWERLQEAEHMARVYGGLGHAEAAAKWRTEAARLRLLLGVKPV